jgi:hypothetical protein
VRLSPPIYTLSDLSWSDLPVAISSVPYHVKLIVTMYSEQWYLSNQFIYLKTNKTLRYHNHICQYRSRNILFYKYSENFLNQTSFWSTFVFWIDRCLVYTGQINKYFLHKDFI